MIRDGHTRNRELKSSVGKVLEGGHGRFEILVFLAALLLRAYTKLCVPRRDGDSAAENYAPLVSLTFR